MADGFVCWKCGASIAGLPMPLARVAECSSCRADLHVCRLCAFYDSGVAKSCREPVAEEVLDKQRANFCGYFQVKAGAYSKTDEVVTQVAQAQLQALFGGSAQGTAQGYTQGGGGKDQNNAAQRTETDIARERLEQMFNTRGKG